MNRRRGSACIVALTNMFWALSVVFVVLWMKSHELLLLDSTSTLSEAPILPMQHRPRRRMMTEVNVISFAHEPVHQFIRRNHHSFGDEQVLWVPGVDGYHQPTLNQWGRLIGEPPIKAAKYNQSNPKDKSRQNSPHAVGCYLAHWHLLRSLQGRDITNRPELFFVFEDDASCIPGLIDRVTETVRKLPSDWDMFYIGGKPFTRFSDELKFNFSDSTELTLRRDICRGAFGKGDSPLAPDASRQLSVDQPYWQVKYITNTHAYVINPRRVNRILEVIKPRKTVPIDILLAMAMQNGNLTVYMSTELWCEGNPNKLNEPAAWRGYFKFMAAGSDWHPAVPSSKTGASVWQKNITDSCPY